MSDSTNVFIIEGNRYIKMPRPFLINNKSDYLVWIVDINSRTEWLTVQI